nr:collagen alpha-1(I) chain-like [Vicugna pacos]
MRPSSPRELCATDSFQASDAPNSLSPLNRLRPAPLPGSAASLPGSGSLHFPGRQGTLCAPAPQGHLPEAAPVAVSKRTTPTRTSPGGEGPRRRPKGCPPRTPPPPARRPLLRGASAFREDAARSPGLTSPTGLGALDGGALAPQGSGLGLSRRRGLGALATPLGEAEARCLGGEHPRMGSKPGPPGRRTSAPPACQAEARAPLSSTKPWRQCFPGGCETHAQDSAQSKLM